MFETLFLLYIFRMREILIPACHDEYYDEESFGSMEDIYPYTWYSSSKNHMLATLSAYHAFVK